MMKHTIITIGRQFGSGGHEVGNRLAERLNIPLYDHNLIRMAAKELRISDEDATKVDEMVLGRFLSAYAAGSVETLCGLYPGRLFQLYQYIYLCL